MKYASEYGPAILSQWFLDASQYKPVVASQSSVPQAQSAELAVEPSVLEHVANWLHRSLLEVSQKNPVADVHPPEAPQMQGPGLAVAPSPWAQAGPVKAAHRQASELE